MVQMYSGDRQLAEDAWIAVADLADAMLSLRPLADAGLALPLALEDASAVRPGCADPAATALRVAARLRMPFQATMPSAAPHGAALGAMTAIVREHLRPALADPAVARVPAGAQADELLGRVVDASIAAGFDRRRSAGAVRTHDGATLRAYAAGDRDRPAIVLASACGMPASLCETWMRHLAREHFVVTWETRGLFGELGEQAAFDRLDRDVDAQACDAIAVMDHFGLRAAHVMGLCGGAVVALRAAGTHPDRVRSLSLWHGDYELGPATPKTEHQHNLKALMAMAANDRESAAAILGALADVAGAAVPADVAHLVLYPYANVELFYRYCGLTGALMAADVEALLGAVRQECLVVTSEDDATAHPAGSHRVAAELSRGILRVEAHGNHIAVFGAAGALRRLLSDFLAGGLAPAAA